MAKKFKNELENCEIEMDDMKYEDTIFRSCTFIYSGGAFTGFKGCGFEKPYFTFDGAARNTVELLRGFYHGGLSRVVDEIFEDIRKNPPKRPTSH
ncbi:MAG: hypothetical protein OEN23_08245 [Paracoccaceae bacterium]|nr:hypothetical protein [Paracoccaceae bacterium]